MVNKYYQKHKERHQREARERYQNLSEEEKDKRRKNLKKGILGMNPALKIQKILAFEIFFWDLHLTCPRIFHFSLLSRKPCSVSQWLYSVK